MTICGICNRLIATEDDYNSVRGIDKHTLCWGANCREFIDDDIDPIECRERGIECLQAELGALKKRIQDGTEAYGVTSLDGCLMSPKLYDTREDAERHVKESNNICGRELFTVGHFRIIKE